MNPESLENAKRIASEIKRKMSSSKKTLVVLCPPAIFFDGVRGKTKSQKIKFGLQNVFYEKNGSYTGEISTFMAKDMRAEYVILGHSERREMGETDEEISKKISATLRNNMTPIFCIGEKEVDEVADHLVFIKEQLLKGLSGVGQQEIEKIIIAYEPVYAIGATNPVSTHLIHQRNVFIKKILTEKYGKQKAFNVPILYGGAVSDDNSKEIIRDGSVDGLLVGRESLKPENFVEMIKRVESI